MSWEKNEIKHHDELDSFAWWQGYFHVDSEGKSDIYRKNFEELRLRDIAIFSLGDVQNTSILDVGCGSGLYLVTFLKLGAKYVAGQDIDESSINCAKGITEKLNLNADLKIGDCSNLQFADNTFDFVFSGDVFEHITEKKKDETLKEIFRVLKPGGTVVIKTPNKNYLKMSLFYRRIFAVFHFKNPFKIHIEHTRNNPTNEHLGLTTHLKLKKLFLKNMFHYPEIIYQPLHRNRFPGFLSNLFVKNLFFNEQITMKARKPVFYCLY
jgi:2-polyprenyl-3-methyl-5-hydroxy-6-metoxy-1,4-benzoquinol methylase